MKNLTFAAVMLFLLLVSFGLLQVQISMNRQAVERQIASLRQEEADWAARFERARQVQQMADDMAAHADSSGQAFPGAR